MDERRYDAQDAPANEAEDLLAADFGDDELVALFSAFDDVRASEELKASTLASIFAQLDADEAQEARAARALGDLGVANAIDQVEDVEQAPAVEAIEEPDELAAAREAEIAAAPASEVAEGDSEERAFVVHEGGRSGAAPAAADDAPKKTRRAPGLATPKRHARGWRLKVAAIVLVAVLAAGGTAYSVPASHVTLTEGDVSVKLDVNVFGVTLAASSDSKEGKEVLKTVNVRGIGLEDAMGKVVDGLSARGDDDGSVKVELEGGFGPQRESMDAAAGRVITSRGRVLGEGGRAPDEPASQSAPASQVTQAEPATPSGGLPAGERTGGAASGSIAASPEPEGQPAQDSARSSRESTPQTQDAPASQSGSLEGGVANGPAETTMPRTDERTDAGSLQTDPGASAQGGPSGEGGQQGGPAGDGEAISGAQGEAPAIEAQGEAPSDGGTPAGDMAPQMEGPGGR